MASEDPNPFETYTDPAFASEQAARSNLPPASALEGSHLGPYRVVRLLGHGGMGSVYLAERADGRFDKQVALKLMRQVGVEAAVMLRRFEHEQHILARLEHPHIARLYDAGLSEDGQSYLVMEYIEGISLDTYCDQHQLGIEARLRLFMQVLEAVQYAHSNLIVHRDLKPANILVLGDKTSTGSEIGHVKLLDFGIAKLISEDENVTLTQTGQRVMTPAYAAPEQIRGEPVMMATDVYALGVLLYELLSGQRPYKAEGAFELEHAIVHQEPSRPSTAVTDNQAAIGTARGTTLGRLRNRLSGDLDTIILKALQKDPARRYGSAEQFLEDVRRHLEGLPIQARPDTLGYRVQKFVGRHRAWVTAAVLVLLSLVGGLTMALREARIATHERDMAHLEHQEAETVMAFLTDMLQQTDPNVSQQQDVTIRQFLDQSATRIETALGHQPEVQAELWTVIGKVYLGLGQHDEAEHFLRRALERKRVLFGPEHEEFAHGMENLGAAALTLGRNEEADSLLTGALSIYREHPGPHDQQIGTVLGRIGDLHLNRGDFGTADSLYREVLAIQRQNPETEDTEIARTLTSRVQALKELGQYTEAELMAREAITLYRNALGPTHALTVAPMQELSTVLFYQGNYEAAETMAREVLATVRRIFGDRHERVAMALSNLAVILNRTMHYDEAIALYQESADILREVLGDDHDQVAATLDNLGQVLDNNGQFDEAEQALQEALSIRRGNDDGENVHH